MNKCECFVNDMCKKCTFFNTFIPSHYNKITCNFETLFFIRYQLPIINLMKFDKFQIMCVKSTYFYKNSLDLNMLNKFKFLSIPFIIFFSY